MAFKVAINGFGRIGRNILRAFIENDRTDIDIVAINDLGSAETNARLLKYDSVHGTLNKPVMVENNTIIIGDKTSVLVTSESDPSALPWSELDIDIVLECTGLFKDKRAASAHLKSGAKRVLISAPSSDADITVVYGVNDHHISPDHIVVSNASCTTNCLAPIAKLLNETIGIMKGFMTTVHAYTGDQNILDAQHNDPRRARACTQSMIPTTTGVAQAMARVLPELAGKIEGTAIRVPTPNVSLIDLSFTSGRDTSVEEIHDIIRSAAAGPLKGIVGLSEQPLVSIDFNHNPDSSTLDLNETQVIDGNFVRILSWYDNEWGFSNRMLDTTVAIGKKIQEHSYDI